MNSLYMGVREVYGKKEPHVIEPNDMKRHLFITGQSGSGKSTLVGRLAEEIILRDAGHVLFLDCNFEFSQFAEVNPAAFTESFNRKNCPEDQLDVFKKAWVAKKPNIQTIKANEINILYRNIEAYLKAPLLGIDRDRHPGAYWLLQMLEEHQLLKDEITRKDSLPKFISDIARWFEGRAKEEEVNKYGLIIHEIRRYLSALDLTMFNNASKRLSKQRYVSFKADKNKKPVDETLVKALFDSTCFCSIDLLGFPYEHHHFRDFTVLHVLYCIWKEATERFVKMKTTRGQNTSPIFIVIDEAHNIAPRIIDQTQSPPAQEVARIVRTIAAEGRKFGLFLILVSQRPDKIDENVLSECDNFIIMKSTPPTIGRLAEYIGVRSDKKLLDELEQAISFNKGIAFYRGAFTPASALFKVDGDIKRTK